MKVEMEMEERSKPIAIFMAFDTKGDVYPIAVSPSVLFMHFLFGCLENNYRKTKANGYPDFIVM